MYVDTVGPEALTGAGYSPSFHSHSQTLLKKLLIRVEVIT